MIPNWRSITTEDALLEAARYLSRIRPLGAEPKIQGATRQPDMIEASWYVGSGQVAVGIAIRKIPVEMPVTAMRLSVDVFWPQSRRPPAAARAISAIQEQISDVACVLAESLAGQFWVPEP